MPSNKQRSHKVPEALLTTLDKHRFIVYSINYVQAAIKGQVILDCMTDAQRADMTHKLPYSQQPEEDGWEVDGAAKA